MRKDRTFAEYPPEVTVRLSVIGQQKFGVTNSNKALDKGRAFVYADLYDQTNESQTNRNSLSECPFVGKMYEAARLSMIFGVMERGFVLAVNVGLPAVKVRQILAD